MSLRQRKLLLFNFLVAAVDLISLKKIVTEKEMLKMKNMHIDAVREIEMVDGYKLTLIADQSNTTKLINYAYSEIKKI